MQLAHADFLYKGVKEKLKLWFRVLFIIVFIRPNRWRYEIDKLKKGGKGK